MPKEYIEGQSKPRLSNAVKRRVLKELLTMESNGSLEAAYQAWAREKRSDIKWQTLQRRLAYDSYTSVQRGWFCLASFIDSLGEALLICKYGGFDKERYAYVLKTPDNRFGGTYGLCLLTHFQAKEAMTKWDAYRHWGQDTLSRFWHWENSLEDLKHWWSEADTTKLGCVLWQHEHRDFTGYLFRYEEEPRDGMILFHAEPKVTEYKGLPVMLLNE